MLPLAERLRPKTLKEYIGQRHLVGEGAILRQMIERSTLSSFILWGPPGVGKTTLARIIAHEMERPFYTLSAVTSGVKEVREIIDKAKRFATMNSGLFGRLESEIRTPLSGDRRAILFIDEIHRFSKSQQDSLLGAVEDGTITLIGATTENPSFEVITPLLSRCQVYILKSLEKADLLELLHRALTEDEHIRSLNIEVQETESILRYSSGDARKLLNIIELVTNSGVKVIDNETVTKQLQQTPVAYDKDGELHYDIVSAFIKSIRGSAPDAALYWLARMVAAGEDPKFIARRLVISASEDIGLANPNAMLVANACFDTLQKIGWPEGRIPLAMATVYLATSQKSNSAYLAINQALELVEKTGNLPVPLHLRNAPTKLMDELGYGEGYKYAHDFPNHFVKQQFMPDALQGTQLWQAQGSPQEQKMAEWMKYLWGDEAKGEKR
ncbi:MAG: replication-associated recombination protein A [Paludibacteraceae bacterium]|nr:replication-associated recombination protein A [Paludibacteraceae bacterium]